MMIVAYSLYLALSNLCRSNPEDVIRSVLPFVSFFASRVFINNEKKFFYVIFAFFVGYSIPIIGSFIVIYIGSSDIHVRLL